MKQLSRRIEVKNMFHKKLQLWLENKKKGYRCVKSEIMKYPENGTGMFRFAKHQHYFSKRDHRGVLMRGYYTAPVGDEMDFESASLDAMSFKFIRDDTKAQRRKPYVAVSHYLISYDKNNNIRTEGTEWNFEDGSFIVELVALSESKNAPCPLCADAA